MNKINIKEFVANSSADILHEIELLELPIDSNIPKKIIFIRVGNDPASISYMKSKSKYLTDAGFEVQDILLDDQGKYSNVENVIQVIKDANKDDSVLGILVQSPIPNVSSAGYNFIINYINESKDIDGFSNSHIVDQYETGPMKNSIMIEKWPCTPLGILYYLDKVGYTLKGKKVAIIGRSDIVGKPLALAMINLGAIVTVYNSNMPIDEINKDLRTIGFNVIIGAIGKPQLIELRKDEEQPNKIENLEYVFDVGINRVPDESDNSKFKLVGDIKIDDSMSDLSFSYTTVPGGVGLLTRLGLLLRAKNMLRFALLRFEGVKPCYHSYHLK